MGAHWMGLEPSVFMHGFWSQFTTFLVTIMPLLLLTLIGRILSAWLDWNDPKLKPRWSFPLGLYVATSLITLG